MKETKRPLKVLIVDDDPLLCNALGNLLEQDPLERIEVVGEAFNAAEAYRAIESQRPDVVLMDIKLPGEDGIQATANITKMPNPPQVIVITTLDSQLEPLRAIEAGAAAFLLKSEDPNSIIEAIVAVARGEGAVSAKTARQLFTHLEASFATPEKIHAQKLIAQLSPAELEVAKLVTQGLSNSEISAQLFISTSTVKTHIAGIMQKFSVTNRVLIAVTLTLAQI